MLMAVLDVVFDVALDFNFGLVNIVLDDLDSDVAEVIVAVAVIPMASPYFKFNAVVCSQPQTCNLFESARTMLNVPIIG